MRCMCALYVCACMRALYVEVVGYHLVLDGPRVLRCVLSIIRCYMQCVCFALMWLCVLMCVCVCAGGQAVRESIFAGVSASLCVYLMLLCVQEENL